MLRLLLMSCTGRRQEGGATEIVMGRYTAAKKTCRIVAGILSNSSQRGRGGDSQQYPLMWSWMLRPYHILLCLGYRLIQGVHPHNHLPPCTRHSVLSLFCKCPVSSPAASCVVGACVLTLCLREQQKVPGLCVAGKIIVL